MMSSEPFAPQVVMSQVVSVSTTLHSIKILAVLFTLQLVSTSVCAQTPLAQMDAEGHRLFKAYHQNPKDSMRQYAWANYLYRKQSYAKALQAFHQLTLKEPNNADFLLGKAQTLVKLNRVPEAHTTLKRAVSIAPKYEDLWALLISTCNASSACAQEYEAYTQKAAGLFPNAFWLPLPENKDAAWYQAEANRLESQKAPISRYRRGLYLSSLGQHLEALAILKSVHSEQPNNDVIKVALANAHMAYGRQLLGDQRPGSDMTAVRSTFEKAIALLPDEPTPYRLYLKTCTTGNDPACQAIQQKASHLFPQAFWLKQPLAANTPPDQIQGEIAQLRAHLSSEPDDTEAVLRLGRYLQLTGQSPVPAYNAFLAQSQAGQPDANDVQVAKAVYLSRSNQKDEAKELLAQVLSVAPSHEEALRYSLSLCGPADDCTLLEKQALRYFPDAFWVHRGSIPIAMDGKPDQAWLEQQVANIKQHFQYFPEDAEALFFLGRYQEALGRHDDAIQTNRQLVALAPSEPDYQERLSESYYKKAAALYRQSRTEQAPASQEVVTALSQSIALAPANPNPYRLYLKLCKNTTNQLNCEPYQTKAAATFPGAFWLEDFSAISADEQRASLISQIQSHLLQNPDDDEAQYALFQLYKQSNQSDAALQVIQQLHAEQPNEETYTFALARHLQGQNQPAESLTLLQSATESNQIQPTPEYYELKLAGEQQLKHWSAYKQTYLSAVAAYPNGDWKRWDPHQIDGVFARQELDVLFNYQDVTNGRQAWNEQTIAYNVKFPNRVSLEASVNRYRRFGIDDYTYTLGAGIPLGKWLTSRTEGLLGPQNSALPEWGILQEVSLKLPWGFNAIAAYQHKSYEIVNVNSGIYTLEKYQGPFRLAYTFNNAHIQDTGVANTHSATINWFYRDRSRIGLTLAMGRNIENILPFNQIIDKRTLGASLGGIHYVTPRWGIHYGLFIDYIEDIFTRRGFTLGVKRVL